MMSLEEENYLEKIVDTILKHSFDPIAQRTSLRAALRVFYLKGHQEGYNEAMADVKAGKDKRVVAHLN